MADARPRAVRGGRKARPAAGPGAGELDRLERWLEEKRVQKAKIGAFDVDGVWRGKYVSLEKLRSAAKGGLGFCDVVFGWDLADELYDNAKVTGWHTGYPDAHALVDLSTARVIPWEPDTAAFILDFVNPDGSPFEPSPRAAPPARRPPRARARVPAALRIGVRVLHLQGDAAVAPREGLPRARDALARHVRLLVAAQLRELRPRPCAHRRAERVRRAGRGDAHRDRAGRVRDRGPLRRPGARRRQGGALQDGGEGDLRAPRAHRLLHGEVERVAPRLLRPRA